MRQAIITGASGFIGARLAKFLAHHGIEVFALGRKSLSEIDPSRLQETDNLHYVQIDMNDIKSLPSKLEKYTVNLDDCVFYNFAWAGKNGLSDLSVEGQLNNVVWSLDAYEVADELKCKKFVHLGTMEEAFANDYLAKDYHVDSEYNRHLIYSIAKKTSRNILKAARNHYSTELIIASNSHIMGPNDHRDSLLRMAMKWMIEHKPLEFTSGKQNFDVVSVTDCVRAFKLIGEIGKDKAEYWIGSGQARTLREYIEILVKKYEPEMTIEFGKINYNDVQLPLETFSPKKLFEDTGFVCKQSYEDVVEEMYQYLKFDNLIENNEL
jgi:nucleoside-diphosphate-sugar epimerase